MTEQTPPENDSAPYPRGEGGSPESKPFPFAPKSFPSSPGRQPEPPPPNPSPGPEAPESVPDWQQMYATRREAPAPVPPPPPPPSTHAPSDSSEPPADAPWTSDIYVGEAFVGEGRFSVSDVDIPDEPPPPPELIPPKALFGAIGAGAGASVAWMILSNTCCGWYFWTWIFGLALIGTAVGSAAAKLGGSGNKMGIICAAIAFLSMLASGIGHVVLAFIIMAIGAAHSASAQAPLEQQVDARIRMEEEAAAEILRQQAMWQQMQQQQAASEDDWTDEEDDMGWDDNGWDDEESWPEEWDNDVPSFGLGQLATDIFLIFNCWGAVGIIIGMVSAYKIGSGFDQTGYQR